MPAYDDEYFGVSDQWSIIMYEIFRMRIKNTAPDAKAIWLFKEKLIKAKVSEKLFDTFFFKKSSSILRTERF